MKKTAYWFLGSYIPEKLKKSEKKNINGFKGVKKS
jgi:hypothetical protein